MGEKELVSKILSGDLGYFEVFVEKYKRLVSHVVFRLISNSAEREDLCQDVFLKIYKNLKNFTFEAKLSTWIAKIAYNTSINHLEKKKASLFEDFTPEGETIDSLSGSMSFPDEIAVEKNISDLLHAEIEKLPPVYRTIITLYHLDEMSYGEIVDITGLPEGTVKSYIFRARQLLKKRLLEKYHPEEIYK